MRPKDPLRSKETLTTIQNLVDDGINRMCVIMRHSDRHFHPEAAMEPFMGLTEAGKDYAMDLGAGLPEAPRPIFFSSPFGRCIETACIMDKGYIRAHGRFNGHNTLATELSPFYIRDMNQAFVLLSETGSPVFLRRWFNGQIPTSAMADPRETADIIAGFMVRQLENLSDSQIALCVSHDWNIYPLKEFKLGLKHENTGSVGFLESLVVFEHNGKPFLTGFQTEPQPLT
ncbi:MAG: histidine phosphatase family protein [Pseudomonadota bacterium]